MSKAVSDVAGYQAQRGKALSSGHTAVSECCEFGTAGWVPWVFFLVICQQKVASTSGGGSSHLQSLPAHRAVAISSGGGWTMATLPFGAVNLGGGCFPWEGEPTHTLTEQGSSLRCWAG